MLRPNLLAAARLQKKIARSWFNVGSYLDEMACLKMSDEVRVAIAAAEPVVALESTIVAHGMPWPQNLLAAIAVEDTIRQHGAIPATVAVFEGRPTVGLNRDELEVLARTGPSVLKCSIRELPLAVSKGIHGATTVASTSYLAAAAGVDVFVTGGAGGVHRGGQDSLDVSADLVQLSHCPIVVVSAGVKSILDIPRTLEFLETQSVCVAAYKTDEFPAFFTPHSGCPAPARLDSPEEVAAHFHAARDLGLASATLLAVPNPEPAAAAPVEEATRRALAAAEEQGISGAAVTPFVLQYVTDATGGMSLEANIALVMNNARVGAKIAVQIANAEKARRGLPITSSSSSTTIATAAATGGSGDDDSSDESPADPHSLQPPPPPLER